MESDIIHLMTCNIIISAFHSFLNTTAGISVRPSEGKAEGGCGGNSAVPSQKIEASSATLLSKARHHRKILFSLREEEIWRAQNEKSKEYFSVVWRAERAVAGLASSLGVLRKMGSDFFKQTPLDSFLTHVRYSFVASHLDAI